MFLPTFTTINTSDSRNTEMSNGCCFSFTSTRNKFYKYSFSTSGLKSTTIQLDNGVTTIHYWCPKTHHPSKPTLLLIHGIGANAMWQWNDFVSPLSSKFNIYVPDLLFFGESYTTRPERDESFQAQCVMKAMESVGCNRMSVVGLSYGGFVAYSMAAQFPEKVERVVIGCAGVCLEEKDMNDGMFRVKSVDEAVGILLAQSPDKLRELIKISFYKPVKHVPSCFLSDFIDVMCTENFEERKELIVALHKGRKMDQLPKIKQPTLIIWGEHDQIFPLELAHRLKRHLENNAQLVVLKNAGHAINMEKTKEMYSYLKSFLCDPVHPKHQRKGGDDRKVD